LGPAAGLTPETFIVCVLVPLWLFFPVHPGWGFVIGIFAISVYNTGIDAVGSVCMI
jgi:hypothetical protein